MGTLMGTSELDDFGTFYRRTYAAAYRTALGITSSAPLAEDVTQEAFCAAYRRRESFRGDGSAEHWLQRIVVNEAIDQLRSRRARPIAEIDPELAVEGGSASSLAVERVALLAALAGLNPRQRAAIVLRYFHDYSMRTVGEVLGTSEGGAAMLVQRALAGLRREIGGETVEQATVETKRGGAR
jgi:RNA polymerase sigma-70 factor, ECF subfamily